MSSGCVVGVRPDRQKPHVVSPFLKKTPASYDNSVATQMLPLRSTTKIWASGTG